MTSRKNRNILKINILGAPNEFTPKHPAGGYYAPHIKGLEEKHKGKTKRQRKTYKQRPLPGSAYPRDKA